MTTLSATRVLVVEDHPMMRAGVRDVLSRADDIEVVGEAGTGERALTLTRSLSPDVVLLDIGLPDIDGLAVLGRLREAGQPARVIMLTCQIDEQSVRTAMDGGASGYLSKDAAPKELVDAVRSVCRGQTPLSPEAATRLVASMRSHAGPGEPELTRRERDVWHSLAEGASNAEIAAALFISEHTVKFHLHNLLRKLGLKSRSEAICAAYRRGILN
jgi:DNA-binding NarL/FixJ family response regulator